MKDKAPYHEPVLARAAIDGLAVCANGRFVDVTFGGGGHSRLILELLGSGKLVAFDQDREAESNLPDDERILFLNHNFRYLKNFLKLHGLIPVDGILADLGVSSYHFDEPQRGFSFRFDGPLDMRMDQGSKLTANEVINEYPIEKLVKIFKKYGELRNPVKIAETIEKHRNTVRINSTGRLREILGAFAPRGKENKFLAKVFQALRIEVNQEVESLKEFLLQTAEVLKPGGRLVVISYHSLEDRLVKNFMKSGNFEGVVEKDFFGNPLTPFVKVGKKMIADQKEVEKNNRARSAILRIAKKRD